MPLAYLQRTVIWVFLLFFSTSFSSFAASWEMCLKLEGEWKFRIGDNPKWSNLSYNDSNWERVQVPAAWETQGFHAYDGYGWYRKTFNLSREHAQQNLFLSLGYIDDVDEVFINGKLIGFSGSFPPYFQTAYNAFRRYPIPKEYLNPEGKNTIAIRVYDARVDGGIIGGAIGLVSNADYNRLDVNLSGLWEFRLGDNLDWRTSEVASKQWERVMAPLFWEKQGFVNYDGYAWYRKSFYLPSDLKGEDLVLLLGMIDDFDQTYINGVLVGSTGFNDNNEYIYNDNFAYSTIRKYNLPLEALNFGGFNTIAIRVFDKYLDGGIYNGPLGIIKQGKYTDFWRRWWR